MGYQLDKDKISMYGNLLSKVAGIAFRCLYDRKCSVIYISDGCAEITGWNASEFSADNNRSLRDLTLKEDLERLDSERAEGFRSQTGYEIDYRIKTKDDSIKWIRENASASYDENGNIEYFEGFISDITTLKETAGQLEERDLRISQIMKIADIGILLVNRTGKIQDINEAFCRMTGLEKIQVLNKKAITLANKLLKPKDATALIPIIVKGLLGHKTEPFELTFNQRFIRIDTADTSDERILAFFTDITKKKEYEDTLHRAQIKTEESDRLKSSFLANMSHEIRTPMNGILGFSELLRDPELPDEEKVRFIDIIHANSEQLLHIIDDVLDLSRIEAGRLGIYPEVFDPYELLKKLVETTKILAKHKDISITLKYDLPIGATIESDIKRVQQVLFSLISNAIKFTDQGNIEIGCYRNSWEYVEFFVKDTGIGIPSSVGQRIFEHFRQAKEGDTRPYGGTGLGLALSKALVTLWGGQIGFTSVENKGSHFYFTIPDVLRSID